MWYIFRLAKSINTNDHEILSKISEILMVSMEYHYNGLKLFSLNDTNMFRSKILYQELSLMTMVYLKVWF